jgi:hypothetical protein
LLPANVAVGWEDLVRVRTSRRRIEANGGCSIRAGGASKQFYIPWACATSEFEQSGEERRERGNQGGGERESKTLSGA